MFKLLIVLFGPFILIAGMGENNGRYATKKFKYTYNMQPADLRETANRFTSLHWSTSCNCKDWIWNLCWRTMKWILIFIKVVRRKPIVWKMVLITARVLVETQNIISEKKCRKHPNWYHHGNNTPVSHKFLVSEMKVNSKEPICTYSQNTQERDD